MTVVSEVATATVATAVAATCEPDGTFSGLTPCTADACTASQLANSDHAIAGSITAVHAIAGSITAVMDAEFDDYFGA